ncbi:hypothetical protein BVC80_9099g245 [Macleaya cordata]|uniref:Uncharacterized protein n=1 Tax=Macleaya cordata TaxID=56857 RepID=A0A200PW34_MACCD|nr:hypothetical protein BVC80_9099g245 [Macleaya cordata]
MRQRELVEFRTPQHPSLGTNNWGGASPLLARNLPKESLDLRYLRLNTVRSRDEIFPVINDVFIDLPLPPPDPIIPSPRGKYGLFSRFTWLHRDKTTLGTSQTRRPSWLPLWDPSNRWPQGW